MNPAAGTYTVQVEGYAVPAGTTEFDYTDVFFSSGLGQLQVPSTTLNLAAGQSAPISGSIAAASGVTAGRQLFGEMQVLSSTNLVAGKGTVVIEAVNP